MNVLGLPLEEALQRLRAQGVEPQVVRTSDGRSARTGGTLRVVRVRPGQVVVSAFLDGAPDGVDKAVIHFAEER